MLGWLALANVLQVKVSYQHAVKESIVLLGFEDPAKAAQLAAHHVDNVRVRHPVPEQGCVNLAEEGGGQVVTGMQVKLAGSLWQLPLSCSLAASPLALPANEANPDLQERVQILDLRCSASLAAPHTSSSM